MKNQRLQRSKRNIKILSGRKNEQIYITNLAAYHFVAQWFSIFTKHRQFTEKFSSAARRCAHYDALVVVRFGGDAQRNRARTASDARRRNRRRGSPAGLSAPSRR